MKLSIEHLSMTYISDNKKIHAVEDINLTIEENEFICILGPSGCGKSTILRCIAAYEKPTNGRILLDSEEIRKPGPDRAMVFQGFDQLFPWLTVRKNIEFPLNVNKIGFNREKRREIAEYYIKMINLNGFEDAYPHQLSGGMRQRVAIARALSLHPKILLMDEPFGSLDAFTRSSLQKELLRIWEKTKLTVIFVTHNIEEAINLSTKIIVLSQHPGKVIDIIENRISRPRMTNNPEYIYLWEKLNNIFGLNTFSQDNKLYVAK